MPSAPGRSRRSRSRGLIGLCVLAVALTAACGPSPAADPGPTTAPASGTASPSTPASSAPTGTPSADDPGAAEALITIRDFAFLVPDVVAAGATITVVNEDSMTHTVTSTQAGSFDLTIAGGATGTFTAPDQAGSYDFVCSFHGNMTGVLVVA